MLQGQSSFHPLRVGGGFFFFYTPLLTNQEPLWYGNQCAPTQSAKPDPKKVVARLGWLGIYLASRKEPSYGIDHLAAACG